MTQVQIKNEYAMKKYAALESALFGVDLAPEEIKIIHHIADSEDLETLEVICDVIKKLKGIS